MSYYVDMDYSSDYYLEFYDGFEDGQIKCIPCDNEDQNAFALGPLAKDNPEFPDSPRSVMCLNCGYCFCVPE